MNTNFPKSRSHVKVLEARRLAWSKSLTESPHMFVTTVQNSVTQATSRRWSVHPANFIVSFRNTPSWWSGKIPVKRGDTCTSLHGVTRLQQCLYRPNSVRQISVRGTVVWIYQSFCINIISTGISRSPSEYYLITLWRIRSWSQETVSELLCVGGQAWRVAMFCPVTCRTLSPF